MPETEVKPETKDGQQAPGPASTASAPEKKDPHETGASEVERAEKLTDNREVEKKRTFFQARQERKESLAEQIASLQADIKSLKETRESPRSDGRKSILDAEDPVAYLDGRFDTLKKDIEEVKSFKKALEDDRKGALRYQAEEYLLSRKHLEDPQFGEEIRNRLHTDPSLAVMSEFDPIRAAKSAYIETCEARGIAPDLAPQSLPGRAAGPRPTVTRSVDKEDRSFGEWQNYIRQAQAGSEDHVKRSNEMRQAIKEGKIK